MRVIVSVILMIPFIISGCKKEIDPRDQYLGNYSVTYESITVDSLNNKTFSNTTTGVLSVEKGQQYNLIVFKDGQNELATAQLNNNKFLMPKTTFSYSDASGKLFYYDIEAKGSFQDNKLDMSWQKTVKYAITISHIIGTRK